MVTHHPLSQPLAASPARAGKAVVLVGHLAGVDEHNIVIVPRLDSAYSLEIRRQDVLAFDTVSASGTCRVVAATDAVIVERRTVSVVHSRALTAGELYRPARLESGEISRRA